jgi:cell wall assembly regulator SMI1
MKETLAKLDEFIKDFRPNYYENLNPPLSRKQIEELENKYKIVLPNDLQELYLWKNGQSPNCYESFVNNSEFTSLEEVLETAAEFTLMIGTDFEIENWWNAHWLPIFHNGGGSRICYDLQGIFTKKKGQILEFWKADNDRNVIAPDLNAFLRQIVDYYQTIKVKDFDEFFEVKNITGFAKKFYAE